MEAVNYLAKLHCRVLFLYVLPDISGVDLSLTFAYWLEKDIMEQE